jgi:hypothetical protein
MSEQKVKDLIEKVKKLSSKKRQGLVKKFCDRVKIDSYNPDDRDIAVQMGIDSGELDKHAV